MARLNYNLIHQAHYVVKSALKGVRFMHEHFRSGKKEERILIHGDLKTDNLFIDASGIVKVADFGFSRVTGTNGRIAGKVGTAEYMAPELLDPGITSYDQKVDVWALGIIAYELMLGYTPFELTSEQEKSIRAVTRGKRE